MGHLDHTRAPWRVRKSEDKTHSIVQAQVRFPHEKGKYWITIAEVNYKAYKYGISANVQDHHKRSNGVAFLGSLEESNARLIACAPELLNALEEAVTQLDREYFDSFDPDFIPRLQAVINKAKGI